MTSLLLTPVIRTAQIVAAKRAIASDKRWVSSPVINDPFASLLAGEEVQTLLERWQQVEADLSGIILKRTRFIAARTRWIDDQIAYLNSSVGLSQVVLLGAGLDSRAYRLNWSPSTVLFEVDLQDVFNYKCPLLQSASPFCSLQRVPANLAYDWAGPLLGAGFNPTISTIWVAEGVLMYLNPILAWDVLKTIQRNSAPGSCVLMDLISQASVDAGQIQAEEIETHSQGKERGKEKEKRNESLSNLQEDGRVRQHWQFGTDDPVVELACQGWRVLKLNRAGDDATHYGLYPERRLSYSSKPRDPFFVMARV